MTIYVGSPVTSRTVTVLDMLKKSLRLIGAIGQGKNPTAQEASDALDAINSMLESWSIERLNVYRLYEETFSWTSGQSSRTIGSSANFDTSRPTRVVSAFTRISNIDYPMRIIDKTEYDRIADKTTTSSYPDVMFYGTSTPQGTLYVYPVPSATISVHITTWKQLQVFSALTDVVTLPLGYQRAIEYNGAIELQGEYPDLPIPEYVIRIAQQSKAAIKTINTPTIIANLGLCGGGRYNIYADA